MAFLYFFNVYKIIVIIGRCVTAAVTALACGCVVGRGFDLRTCATFLWPYRCMPWSGRLLYCVVCVSRPTTHE